MLHRVAGQPPAPTTGNLFEAVTVGHQFPSCKRFARTKFMPRLFAQALRTSQGRQARFPRLATCPSASSSPPAGLLNCRSKKSTHGASGGVPLRSSWTAVRFGDRIDKGDRCDASDRDPGGSTGMTNYSKAPCSPGRFSREPRRLIGWRISRISCLNNALAPRMGHVACRSSGPCPVSRNHWTAHRINTNGSSECVISLV